MFDDPRDNDSRDRNDEWRERELDSDSRERSDDPRDVFLRELNLPRDRERDFVLERNHAYRLNGNDSRTLATVGVFRVISERELSKHHVDHLRGEGLIQKVWLTRVNAEWCSLAKAGTFWRVIVVTVTHHAARRSTQAPAEPAN